MPLAYFASSVLTFSVRSSAGRTEYIGQFIKWVDVNQCLQSDETCVSVHGSSIKETANVLFTSTAFVSKIRRLYRERGEVNRKRRKGRQRISPCILVFFFFFFLFMFGS